MKRPAAEVPDTYDVIGLDAVAQVLGFTAEQLERRMKAADPPPMLRFVGKPVGRRRDLEAWLRAHPNERRAST